MQMRARESVSQDVEKLLVKLTQLAGPNPVHRY
jgi:hypothetical protein